jgi:hypothetical protein
VSVFSICSSSLNGLVAMLDACHLSGATGDGSALTSNADLLRSIIAASNVTVLTSRIR